PDGEPLVSGSPEEWKREGLALSRKHAALFLDDTRDACGRSVRFDRKRVVVATRGERDSSSVTGIRLSAPVRLALNLQTPRDANGSYQFDVVRVRDQRITGGVTCRIQVTKPRRTGGRVTANADDSR